VGVTIGSQFVWIPFFSIRYSWLYIPIEIIDIWYSV